MIDGAVAPAREPRRNSMAAALVFPFVASHLLFVILWMVLLIQDGPRFNDWRHFQVAAEQFVSGQWSELYTQRQDTVHPGYFWRYPPFALYLVAPLAWVNPAVAYGILATLGIAALFASVALLARLTAIRELKLEWAAAIVLSAQALTTLVTGQISTLLLLCAVGATVLWARGRSIAAGALLGLFALKPNLGLFFGLFVIAQREWRGLAAMLGVVMVLCATTAPLGLELWRDFVRVSLSNVDVVAQYEPYKMITLNAFLAYVLPSRTLASALWVAASLALLVLAVRGWTLAASTLSRFGLVCLLAIAANPYAFFYDAILLVIPATAWLVERERWRSSRWTAVGWLIAAGWCWEHWAHTWRELLKLVGLGFAPPFSIVGPVAATWLVIAVLDAVARERAHSDSTPQTPIPR